MKRMKMIIQILSFLIFLGCAVYLGNYIYKNYTAQKDINVLRRSVDTADKKSAADNDKKTAYMPNGMLEKYYSLYKKNNDMVGWVKIDGTEINYPVMYVNNSNEYYLHRNFEREYSDSGLPFMDKDCNLAKPGDNLIIYAHNMRNGSMFASLLKYDDKAFLDEHSEICFDTMYSEGKYRIISVFKTQVGAKNEFKYYNFTDSQSRADFENYVSAAKRLSIHDIDASAEYGDKLLTLSTCSYNRKNERYVVVAKKIK